MTPKGVAGGMYLSSSLLNIFITIYTSVRNPDLRYDLNIVWLVDYNIAQHVRYNYYYYSVFLLGFFLLLSSALCMKGHAGQ